MIIYVAAGTGTGTTPLAAFDAALRDAVVENYNLVYLSSIIPPNSTISVKRFPSASNAWGDSSTS